MDLTAASVSAYQQTQIQSQAQYSVAAKVLNIARQQGAAAVQLLQSAARREHRAEMRSRRQQRASADNSIRYA